MLNTCCTTGNIMQNCSYHWIWEYNLIWEINVFPSPIVSISIISIYSIHITNIYLYLLLIPVFVSACATSTCASLRSVLEVAYLPRIANLVMKNSEQKNNCNFKNCRVKLFFMISWRSGSKLNSGLKVKYVAYSSTSLANPVCHESLSWLRIYFLFML